MRITLIGRKHVSWNYRVVRWKRDCLPITPIDVGDDPVYDYCITEVYYDKKGKINGWVDFREDLVEPTGESLDELKDDLIFMLEATTKPVLEIVMNEKGKEEMVEI